eukprot:CAMPEP_0194147144 /NCGR_PEP_ID=MMETSP0152-20130528/22545_1 /TAXON_ID=1049557 /ORGANISM="Thalassiothrix antarctica, Strain L6-D1" /LENGTH=575 /DNA_ID=CAMNT_0038847839 /DNA_START=85 /DNA_END=1812 /DNA_ORIENTATION=-
MEYDGGGYLRQTGANVSRDHDPPVTWDAEEDHLLSYFLDEVNTACRSTQHNQINPSSHLQHHVNLYQENSLIPSTTASATSTTTNSIFPASHVSRYPCTPAVQFYAPNTSIHHSNVVPRAVPLDSNSSSSSSLSSIPATLMSGSPILQSQPQLQQPQNPYAPQALPRNAISSISLTSNMGTSQEMMMLPPPPRQQTDAERHQHLAWLSHVNSQPQTVVPSIFGPLAPNSIVSMSQTYGNNLPRQTESQERRVRRLARNRESARQSRRRKKDKLSNLSGQVNQLHSYLDQERRRLFSELEPKLQELRQEKITELGNARDDRQRHELIRYILNRHGTNCIIRNEAASFQYDFLKQLMLPKYQIFILWLTLQYEGFYTAGKHERAITEGVNNRLSSKQIGEELTNKWKNNSMDISDEINTLTTLTAQADDPLRLWPLFSFDMSISVDQEERFLHFHKRAQETPELEKDRCELSNATKLITTMKKGILSHSRSTHERSERLLGHILEPEQSAKFLKWYQMNSHRIWENMPKKQEHLETNNIPIKESSVSDVCKRINENLRLPEDFEEDRTILKLEDDFW